MCRTVNIPYCLAIQLPARAARLSVVRSWQGFWPWKSGQQRLFLAVGRLWAAAPTSAALKRPAGAIGEASRPQAVTAATEAACSCFILL